MRAARRSSACSPRCVAARCRLRGACSRPARWAACRLPALLPRPLKPPPPVAAARAQRRPTPPNAPAGRGGGAHARHQGGRRGGAGEAVWRAARQRAGRDQQRARGRRRGVRGGAATRGRCAVTFCAVAMLRARICQGPKMHALALPSRQIVPCVLARRHSLSVGQHVKVTQRGAVPARQQSQQRARCS